MHHWEIPLRWSDIDQLLHVNNVTYYRYMSEARVAWLQSLGALLADDGSSPVVAESGARFLRPMTYPYTVIIDTRLTHLGNRSIRLDYEIRSEKDDALCATGFAAIVWTQIATGEAIRIPAELREYLTTQLSQPDS